MCACILYIHTTNSLQTVQIFVQFDKVDMEILSVIEVRKFQQYNFIYEREKSQKNLIAQKQYNKLGNNVSYITS